MEKKFAGKIAVVIEGSTGMRLAAAKRSVQKGMDHVFATGRRRDALEPAIAQIGETATGVLGDVANLKDLLLYGSRSPGASLTKFFLSRNFCSVRDSYY